MSDPIIGIYVIRNTENGHRYYGSSANMHQRWNRHLNLLRNRKHFNPHLQAAWNLYGEENFEFVVMERCSVTELKRKEQEYLDLSPEYNIAKDTFAPRRGVPLSEEAKRKLSEFAAKRRAEREQWMVDHPGEKAPPIFVFTPTEETIRKRADGNRGRKHSAEWNENMSKGLLGKPRPAARKPRPPVHGQKISAAATRKRAAREQWLREHPGEELPPELRRRVNGPRSEETKRKIAETQRGKPKLSVRDAYARKREERAFWMAEHPGEKPPPIHVHKPRTEAS